MEMEGRRSKSEGPYLHIRTSGCQRAGQFCRFTWAVLSFLKYFFKK